MNTYAKGIELGEYGYDHNLPKIYFALSYCQENQLPLYYELYPGNMIDQVKCEKMMERVKE